jgi:hypothetical protein
MDRAAIEIVTYAILQTYMNTDFDNAMGRAINNKCRRCQQPNAATVPAPWRQRSFAQSLCELSSSLLTLLPPAPVAEIQCVTKLCSSAANGRVLQNKNTTRPASISGVALEMLMSPGRGAAQWAAPTKKAADSPSAPSRRQLCW